ncbi:MAG: hypothetical protein B7Z37_22530 [Verrucomicrobia bacterium 12-59-8]|nr:MAG: hypothetical protein B7Z37_22530 [Verrucomicrobia bacterium 12-59-8]
MKTFFAFFLLMATAYADPQLSSWYTADSSKYARIVETDAALLAGNSETTWTRTSGPNTLAQTLPVYAGPQQIDYSTSWVYLKTPDLATYLMGPWYDNAAKSALFVNIPKNQNIIARFPRSSTIPSTKTVTQGLTVGGVMQDAVGLYADGVAIFDPMDGFSYANGTETSPGTGQWHRDAYVNESITFDKSYAHQQNLGKYHNHANPYGLRYLLGDNVTYDSTTKSYAEGDTTTPARHSPIVGWMFDGLPLYGPYGYSSAMDATSGVRRMIGGYVVRNGATTGVDNITTAGRTVPAWSLRNGGTSVAGPAVSTTYPLGRYIEDNAYLGDLQKSSGVYYQMGTDFDLNEYNVRYCVTPEFPNGTWAYFLNVTSAGSPQFPYMCNRWYYGSPTGGAITSVTETVTNYFKGGENLSETASMGAVNTSTGDVTLSWTSVEGGSYLIQASTDLTTWSTLATAQPAAANATNTSVTESNATSDGRRFYKIQRSALATYDGGGGITYAAPTATTSTASAVGSSSAALNGTVNANGISTTVSFEYGTTTSYGSSVSVSTLSGSTSTSVSTAITGLTELTSYHCRVVATNGYGTTYGGDVTFTTAAAGTFTAPTAATGAASAVATTTATLNGTVNANSSSTTVTFEYGTSTSYGSTVSATPSAVTGSSSTSVACSLAGLTAGSTYYFRVKAVNAGGTTYGTQLTFTTAAASFGTISSVSPSSGSRGSSVTLTVVLGSNPPAPPSSNPPSAASLTGPATLTPTATRDTNTGVVTLQLVIPAGTAVGIYDVNVIFGPNTWALPAGFTVN